MFNFFAKLWGTQVSFPVFSIDPSYLQSVEPLIRRAETERKEVLLSLDFDDTIIKLDETRATKTPVINESLIRFLVALFAQHPTAQFKIIILSARLPDLEIADRGHHPCLLIRSALPLFLSLLNAALEEKSLSDKKITSIDAKDIFCIQGNNGFVKRTYSYFHENVQKSFGVHYWLPFAHGKSEAEIHHCMIDGRIPHGVSFAHQDENCLEKGIFLKGFMRATGASYCLHVDDNREQIESVSSCDEGFVMPVLVCCRLPPSPIPVIDPPVANASSQTLKSIHPDNVEVIKSNDCESTDHNLLSVISRLFL